jgi:hypothetical protein
MAVKGCRGRDRPKYIAAGSVEARRPYLYSPATPGYGLMAALVERSQFRAPQLEEVRRQSSMPIDPVADLSRIKIHHQTATPSGRHKPPRPIVIVGGGVEAQDGPRRDADVVPRDHPGQQSASRQAWPVDYDTLPGRADLMELVYVGGNLASRIADDANIRRRG